MRPCVLYIVSTAMAGMVETVGLVGLVGTSMLLRVEAISSGSRCTLEFSPRGVLGTVTTGGVAETELFWVGVGVPANRIVWRSRTRLSDDDAWIGEAVCSELRRAWRVEVGELEPEASLGVFGGGIFHPVAE